MAQTYTDEEAFGGVTQGQPQAPEVPMSDTTDMSKGPRTYSDMEAFGKEPFDPFMGLRRGIYNTLNAFGDAANQTTEDIKKNLSGDGGEFVDSLRKAGLFDHFAKDEAEFNNSYLYKTALPATLEMAARGAALAGNVTLAPFNIIGSALGQATEELPEGPVKELAQYALNSPVLGEFHAQPHMERIANEGVASGVINVSEDQFRGTAPLTDAQQAQQVAAEAAIRPAPEAAPEAPKDIHQVARQLEPEVFEKYDAASQQQDALRSQLSDLADKRTEDLDAQIDAIREAKSGGYGKLQKLIEQRNDIIAAGDTPEMADLRAQIMKLDEQRRDMAPQVSAAYRNAEKLVPEVEQPKVEEVLVPEMEPPAATASDVNRVFDIASDIKDQLIKTGNLSEEVADNASKLRAAFFDTLGKRFPEYSAQQWYEKLGSVINGSQYATKEYRRGEVAPELAQEAKGSYIPMRGNTRGMLSFFERADASTTVHEFGHEFMDIMSHVENMDGAPHSIKEDMKILRSYAGIDKERPTTRQAVNAWRKGQEKIARSFERYMYEGVAPSKELAGVFSRIKQMMLNIYTSLKKLRAPLTDDVRGVFDRWLAEKPEKTVIAPERHIGDNLAKIHEQEAETVVPAKAGQLRDTIRKEADLLAEHHDKGVYDELTRGRGKTGGQSGAAENATGNANAPEPAGGAQPTAGELGAINAGGVEGGSQSGQVQPEPTTGAGESVAGDKLAARDAISDAAASTADTTKPAAPAGNAKPDSNKEFGVGEGKSDYLDKAGNIRLDLLTSDKDVKDAIREAADQNPIIFNHDVITDQQVADLADAMGIDAREINIQKLRDISVNDGVPLAVRVRAGRQMLIDSSKAVKELMDKPNPTDADIAAFMQAKARHLMISETVSGITNELGRGLRAFRDISKQEGAEAEGITELLQSMTGKTVEQVKAEMKAGSSLKTPAQVSRYVNDTLKPDFFDKLLEYRDNNLLSGPVTHTYYTAGGYFNALYKPLIQIPASVATQAVREAFGAKIKPEERIFIQEAAAQLHALTYGSMRGLQAAAEAWNKNSELILPGELKQDIPLINQGMSWREKDTAIKGTLGRIINTPERVIAGIHSLQKTVRYQQNLASIAVRDAMAKGLEPGSPEFIKSITDSVDNPSADQMNRAGKEAITEVYRERVDYNSTSGTILRAINNNRAMKVLFPFLKMEYNIKRVAFRDNSVLGFLSPKIRADIAGINGEIAKNTAIGKITAGTAIMGLGIGMAAQGLVNGSGPSEQKAYKTWRLTHTPNSVQIGSVAIPFKALGTLGELLAMSGNLYEGAHEFSQEDVEKSAEHFIEKVGAVFTESGFLRQTNDLTNAVFTPGQYAARYLQNFATQWLPMSVGASQVNRAFVDQTQRRVKSEGVENVWGIPDAMRAKYPGLSDTLEPNRDMFGRPIENNSSGYDLYKNDPVVNKMESLDTGIGRLTEKIRGVQLDQKQYDDYSRIAGQMTYLRLSRLVAMPNFNALPPSAQIMAINKSVETSRHAASNTIMKMYPEIIQKAREEKKIARFGKPPAQNEGGEE